MKQNYPEHMELLCQKGYYPYEWVNGVDKLDHKGLPPKNSFYSSLKQETITDKEYKHAQNVYKQLNGKTFKDYHMTYLKCGVLLLADLFENFRKHAWPTTSWTPPIISPLLVLLGMQCC